MKIYEDVAIALGGNIGDIRAVFKKATLLLKENGVKNIKISSLYVNPAKDCIPETLDFTNAVLTGKWEKSPHKLLLLCQKVEAALGRPKDHSSATSRIVDLDIILFGNQIISESDLQIPHKRAHERFFVLVPLVEIVPDWIFPDKKCTASCLLNKLKNLSL